MDAPGNSWKALPFVQGKPIPYRALWSDEQFSRISRGLVPREMEDKWFIHYKVPHLFFHRSWTGEPVYKLTISSTADGCKVAEALTAISFTSEETKDLQYQAKLLAF